jgi:hypothetical protein
MATLAAALSLASPAVAAAQSRPDFSGTWTYDSSQADVDGRVSWPAQLVIAQSATGLQVEETKTRQDTVRATYRFDGSESIFPASSGVTVRARATWSGDKLTIGSRRTFDSPSGEQTATVTETYGRSGDLLTVERTEGGGRPITITYYRGTAADRRAVARTPRPPRTATGEVPRLADGRPDLQGYWTARGRSATDNLEPHPASYAIGASDGVVVDPPDGILPVQSWVAAVRRSNEEELYNDPEGHCLPSGVPRMMYNPMPYQIIYFPDTIVFLFESRHLYRLIRMNGRTHPSPTIALWMGDSYGYWDGDTLVVDSANFNGKQWLDMAGNFVTDGLHVVERLWLVDANTIGYEATVTDPKVYTKPWTMAFTIARNRAERFEILEGACHEGNRDVELLRRVSGKQ